MGVRCSGREVWAFVSSGMYIHHLHIYLHLHLDPEYSSSRGNRGEMGKANGSVDGSIASTTGSRPRARGACVPCAGRSLRLLEVRLGWV